MNLGRGGGRAAALAVLALTLVVTAGCNDVGQLSVPTPPPEETTVAAPPTTAANLSGVVEQPVAGAVTSTSVAIAGGSATIGGTVLGPSGPLAGATVEADRIVGNSFASTQATTGQDGSFVISSVLGGRYRVRAWLAPTMALTTPDIFFLDAGSNQTVTLTLTSYTGAQISAALNPSPPPIGQPANVAVAVVNPVVDAHGVVGYAPVVGASVTLISGGSWTVYSTNPATTNSAGEAVFEVECGTVGSDQLDAAVTGIGEEPLTVPGCVAPPPTTTTTTTSTSSTTSTTVPRAPTTTTPKRSKP